MKVSATHALFVAGLAYAQETFEMSGVGPYDNGSMDIFQDANRSPVATSGQLPFTLWYSEDGNSGPEWQWTVSVAQASVDDSATPNATQLNQVYAFSWPNGGSLSDAVAVNPSNLNTSAFCVTVVESLFPKGTTDNYNTVALDQNNLAAGSCQAPLRTRCLEALTEKIMSRDIQSNGCRATDLDFGTIKQCEWSFEHMYQGSTYNLLRNTTMGMNSTSGNSTSNDDNDSSASPIMSGEGFAHITTETYDGDNSTYLDAAMSRLQMVIIESGSTLTPLCYRISDDSDVGTLEGAAPVTGVNGWLAAAAALFAVAYLI